MDCPRGHGEMDVQPYLTLEVDRCHTCRGMWVTWEEFDGLEALSAPDPNVRRGMIEYSKNPSDLPCPVCHQPMVEFDYRGNPLQLNACENGHGFWLDGGEDEQLRRILEQRAADLRRAAQAEASFGGFLGRMRNKYGGPRKP